MPRLSLLALLAACDATSPCEGVTDTVTVVDWHTVEVQGADGADLSAAWLVDGDGWVVGSGGQAAYTEDGGETWAATSTGSADLHDVEAAADGSFWAVGDAGTLLQAAPADPETWSPVDVDTDADLFAVAWSGNQGVVAGDGVVFTTEDGGVSWDAHTLAGAWFGAWRNSTAWVVGDAGALRLGDEGWLPVAPEALVDGTTIAFLDDDRGLFAGPDGAWITLDGGATWSAPQDPADAALTSITIAGDAYLATGEDGTIYRSQDEAGDFNALFASGVTGLRGLSTFEDNSMPNSQFIAAAPGGQVLVYGSREEVQDVSDRWDACE